MRTLLAAILFLFSFLSVNLQAQQKTNLNVGVSRPKLVVGIMVDQMRWDYLYRFNERFAANGGFKRMLQDGFTCENTFIPYTPTVTACGHTCVYTGSVPSIHGITGNSWWDSEQQRAVYCSEDKNVNTVGSNSTAGKMSPRNMLTTTICDELRLATNFKSKVIGVAFKDRGSILPAGHSANAAYWYDTKNGNWITSTYYMDALPAWVNQFNNKKLADAYYAKGWNTLYPINTYTQSTADVKAYEGKPFGTDQTGFPYDFSKSVGTNYGTIYTTPYGSSFTLEIAKAAIDGEALGQDAVTDFLAVSFSAPDAIGHVFGPNSIETEDTYLRLDKDLGALLDYLDLKVGKNQYTVFLTADHGVAHIPGFLKENKIPGGLMTDDVFLKELNSQIKEQYGVEKAIASLYNYQVHLNHVMIDSLKADEEAITRHIIKYLKKQDCVAQVIEIDELMEAPLNNQLKQMLANGYFPKRSGDIQIILKPGYIDGGTTGTTHGLWNPYDSHIPLLWYGYGIKKGKLHRETYMTDIAPTMAALLKIQMPNGSVGKVIEEVLK
ncbi:MAG: alkaline phosphatase PafA [Flavihumibacter sp.]|nr:alkaline phosphatase PafA [Flavihumibacter sp.]